MYYVFSGFAGKVRFPKAAFDAALSAYMADSGRTYPAAVSDLVNVPGLYARYAR